VLNRNVLPCPNIASISKISHGLTQSVSIVSWYITLKQMQTISKLPFAFGMSLYRRLQERMTFELLKP